MRSALPFLLFSALWLPAVPVSSAQAVNLQTGAVCEPQQPTDMDAVGSKAEAGDASAEYELGRSMLSQRPTDSEFASAIPWFRRSAESGYAPAEYMYGDIFREGRWKNPKQLVYWWTKALVDESSGTGRRSRSVIARSVLRAGTARHRA